MTIYDLLYLMDNMNHDIVIHNDTDDENFGEVWRGSVWDFKETDLYDELQDEEVTDIFTEKDGTMYICYQASTENEPGFYERYRDPYN